MEWCFEGERVTCTLPDAWGGGACTAMRTGSTWRVVCESFALEVRNPRLRTWAAARGAVESCLRAHFEGPAASARAPEPLATDETG